MDVAELLRSIATVWQKQIELCDKAKLTQFGRTASELWSYLGRSYRQLYIETGLEYGQEFANVKGPWYKTRINKSAEFSDLMTAYVLSQLPHWNVSPRRPPLTQELAEAVPGAAQLRARVDADDRVATYLMEWWLNYVASETALKREARMALPEGFVKGRAVLFHELVDAPIGQIPGARFVSVDDIGIDADSRRVIDAGFIYRKRERSVWRVSEETGIPRGQLRALRQSTLAEATQDNPESADSDVCTYYEVYSRMGLGHWLDQSDSRLETLNEALDELGYHCYLEIMPGLGYPMNLNPAALTGEERVEEMKRRLQWPIPFYADMPGDPWPTSFLDFKPHQSDPWTSSPLESGLPMQIFLDHLYAFIMARITVSSKNILLIADAMDEDVVEKFEKGFDLEIVRASGLIGKELEELMRFVEFPQLNPDLWKIVSLVERAFERATGLEPLLYGSEGIRQIRSSKEAVIREAHASSRPDDYADAVDDWLSDVGAKTGLASSLFVGGETVAPLFGERHPQDESEPYGPMTAKWLELISTDDEYQAASQFTYTVAHGQARRRNKSMEIADTQQVIQVLGPPLVQLAQAGVAGPFNAIVEMLAEQIDRPLDRLMIPEGLQLAPEQVRAQQVGAEKKKEKTK